jgi:hypothetical protein
MDRPSSSLNAQISFTKIAELLLCSWQMCSFHCVRLSILGRGCLQLVSTMSPGMKQMLYLETCSLISLYVKHEFTCTHAVVTDQEVAK